VEHNVSDSKGRRSNPLTIGGGPDRYLVSVGGREPVGA
jgi:hypothetical protein